MAIVPLDRVIDTKFLTKLSRASASSSSKTSSSKSGALSGQALYNSLRTGASNFAAGMQLLNASATFINLSLDANDSMLEIVSKMENLSAKANRGSVSASDSVQYRKDFLKLNDEVDKMIEKASTSEENYFDSTVIENVLVRAGLDKEKIDELSLALGKLKSPTQTAVSTTGAVSTDGNPVPIAEIQRALKAAIVDPDDTDDKSGYFSKIRKQLQDIRIKLETNVRSLKSTRDLIGDNMKLVKAAGFAFLDVSNEMTGAESADAIAEDLRARIRANAGAALSQSKNLEPIMVAGLAALSQKSS